MSDKIVFAAKLTLLPAMLKWIREKLKGFPLTASEKNKLEVACEEILVNIIHYAYENKEGSLEIQWKEKEGFFSLVFIDHGIPFNPLKNQKPVIKSLSVEAKEIGGLGIYFIKNFVDKVDYTFLDGANILTISKKFKIRKAI